MIQKYYKPEIKEFREGFEYEWKGDNEFWNKEIYDLTLESFDYGNGDIPAYLVLSNKTDKIELRAALLGPAQIQELLGLPTRKTEYTYNWQIQKEGFFYEIDWDDYNISIEIFVENKDANFNSRTIFEGKVKSKLDFVTLLDQIFIF
jgi:hypothetical protein